jgi:hypothetical protein
MWAPPGLPRSLLVARATHDHGTTPEPKSPCACQLFFVCVVNDSQPLIEQNARSLLPIPLFLLPHTFHLGLATLPLPVVAAIPPTPGPVIPPLAINELALAPTEIQHRSPMGHTQPTIPTTGRLRTVPVAVWSTLTMSLPHLLTHRCRCRIRTGMGI